MYAMDTTQSLSGCNQPALQSKTDSFSESKFGLRSVKKWITQKRTTVNNWLRPGPDKSLSARRVITLAALCIGGTLLLGATVASSVSGALPVTLGLAAAGGTFALGGYIYHCYNNPPAPYLPHD